MNLTITIEAPELAKAIDNLALGLINTKLPGLMSPETLRNRADNQERKINAKAANAAKRKADAEESPEETPVAIKAKKRAAKKSAQPVEDVAEAPAPVNTPEPTPDAPEPLEVEVLPPGEKKTEAEVTELAKVLIAKHSPPVLRAILDDVIGVGVKISTAPDTKLGDIFEAITNKLSE